MDLERVTDELYGAPPERFTARRDELARQAAAEGDKALAASVRALRRPTAAAWVVNHLVRQDFEAVEALVALGERMREAQSTLSGAQMRALSRERQSVLRDLVRHAAALAGGSVSASVTSEVEQTLRAVIADADASADVQSGCLTHGLSYSGLGPAGAGARAGAAPRHLRSVPPPAGRAAAQRAGAGTKESCGDEDDDAVSRGAEQEASKREASEWEASKREASEWEASKREASEWEASEREASEREAAEREAAEREAAERRERQRELAEAESVLRSSERAAAAATTRAERARRRQEEADEEVAELERACRAARERAAAAGAAAESAAEQAVAAQTVAAAAGQEVDRVRPLLDGS